MISCYVGCNLSIPCRPGTSVYRLQDKTSSKACTHALPRALQLWTLPPVGIGSDAATYPTAPNLTSQPRWVSALPRVLWLWTSSSNWGGLWHCHMSYSSGPHLLAELGSCVVTCPMTPDPASRPGRVPVLPRVLWSPMGHGPQIYKERPSWPSHAARLTCFQGTLMFYRGACKTCGQAVSS
jgi:hypothetical protein